MNIEAIRERIRLELLLARNAKTYTQKSVEETIGLPQGSLSKIESGQRNPQWYEIISLCDHYQVNFETLCRSCLNTFQSQPEFVFEPTPYHASTEPATHYGKQQFEFFNPVDHITMQISYQQPPADCKLIYQMVESGIIAPIQATEGLQISIIQLELDMARHGYRFPTREKT